MMTDQLLLLSTCWILQDELENLLTCFLTGWVEILWFVSDPLPSFIYSLRRRAAIVSQISSSAVFVTTAGDCYQMTHQRLTGGWFLSAHFSLLHRLSVSFPPSWKFFFSLSLSLSLSLFNSFISSFVPALFSVLFPPSLVSDLCVCSRRGDTQSCCMSRPAETTYVVVICSNHSVGRLTTTM